MNASGGRRRVFVQSTSRLSPDSNLIAISLSHDHLTFEANLCNPIRCRFADPASRDIVAIALFSCFKQLIHHHKASNFWLIISFLYSFKAYMVDYYIRDNSSNSNGVAEHIGYSYILPLNLQEHNGTIKTVITGTNHKPIGHLMGAPLSLNFSLSLSLV
jgi:hypothetical protein